MTTDKIDIHRLPQGRVFNDIVEFMRENDKEEPDTVYEALDMFLSWNGIVGYTSLILRAVREIEATAVNNLSPVLKSVGPGMADELNEIIGQGQGQVWCNDFVDGAKQLSIFFYLENDGDYYVIRRNSVGDVPKRCHHRHFFIEEI